MVEQEIERVHRPTTETFERYVSSGKPVIITGLLDEWPALSRWNQQYLRDTVGSRRVTIEFYPEGTFYKSWVSVQMEMRRYLELLRVMNSLPEKFYLAEVRIHEHLPELVEDIGVPSVLSGRLLSYTGMFLGCDSVSALHYHAQGQALLCQIVGRKKMTLYPPSDFSNLYFEPWYSQRFNFSQIDFSQIDHQRFPALRNAHPTSHTLEPGEALYIPLHWGHLSEGIGLSMSLTLFWEAAWKHWRYLKPSLHAKIGTVFRSKVSRPLATLIEQNFGYKVAP